MEQLNSSDINETIDLLVDEYMNDPLWVYGVSDEKLRKMAIYSTVSVDVSIDATWVLRDNGKITNAVVFEDPGCMFSILQMFYYPFKYIARESFGGANPCTFVVAILYGLVTCVYPRFLLSMCAFNSNRSNILSSGLTCLKGEGFNVPGIKKLIAIISSSGDEEQDSASDLLNGACNELKKQDIYEGYFIVVADTLKVPFFKRNNFVQIGTDEFKDKTVTYMVRTEDKTALTAGDSIHIMKSK